MTSVVTYPQEPLWSLQVQGVALQYLFFYIPAKNGPGGPHTFKGAPGCVDASGHHSGILPEHEHQSKPTLSADLLQSTGLMFTSHLGGGALIRPFPSLIVVISRSYISALTRRCFVSTGPDFPALRKLWHDVTNWYTYLGNSISLSIFHSRDKIAGWEIYS